MSDIVDDLLQEVEQLEASTQQLNDNVEKVQTQQEELANGASSSAVDSNLLALEAAKTTQEAAKQSHLAAKSSIKLADQLKARNLELDDLSNSWRQATRTTLKDVGDAKNHFTLMMVTTLIINVVGLSVMGYFFYSTNQNNQGYQQEVLDVIQTENALFSKKMTIKLDELTSVTEALMADIKRMPEGAMQVAAVESKADGSMTKDSPETVATPESNMTDTITIAETNKATELAIAKLEGQYNEITRLISALAKQTPRATTAVNTTGTTSLSPEHLKQLKDIRWLVKKQGDALKAIQAKVSQPVTVSSNTNKDTSVALEAVKAELHALSKQQTDMQKQFKKLQDDLNAYIKSKDRAPYSYRSN